MIKFKKISILLCILVIVFVLIGCNNVDEEPYQLVQSYIDNLPTEVNLSDENKLIEARNEYAKLSEEEKKKISNIESLIEKEQRLLELKEAKNNEDAAKIVIELIDLLPTEITLDDKEDIDAALLVYQQLTIAQKELVSNIDILFEKQEQLDLLTNPPSYLLVDQKILSLPEEISLSDEQIILEILKEFNHLSEQDKLLVENKDILDDKFVQVKVLKINDWAQSYIGPYIVEYVEYPLVDPYYGYELTWKSSNEDILDSEGYAYPEEKDIEISINLSYSIDNDLYVYDIDTVVLSFIVSSISSWFESQFNSVIARDYQVNVNNPNYPNAVIQWKSLNPEVFDNEGKLTKPAEDTEFYIEYSIKLEEEDNPIEMKMELMAKGLTLGEKADIIEQWVYDNVGVNQQITESVILPNKYEPFNAKLRWESTDEVILSSTGEYKNPGMDSLVIMNVYIETPNQTGTIEIVFKVIGEEYSNKWDAVDVILDYIYQDTITNYELLMVGTTSYISQNYGYLPFYKNESSTVIPGIVDPSFTRTRPGRTRSEVKYIVIHDTANTNSNAADHNNYINSGKAIDVSWHYTVDDLEIYQHIPDNEIAWHAGTTTSDLYSGNTYGIGIETCINRGVDYNQVMRNAAKLTAELLHKHNLTLSEVKQHFDFSGKNCPQVMRNSGRWSEFLNLVKLEYFAIKNLQGVDFTWESLNPMIMDNNGKIINHPGSMQSIGYKVTVTYNGESRVYEFNSIIDGLTF